jgi:hypothetical protein
MAPTLITHWQYKKSQNAADKLILNIWRFGLLPLVAELIFFSHVWVIIETINGEILSMHKSYSGSHL